MYFKKLLVPLFIVLFTANYSNAQKKVVRNVSGLYSSRYGDINLAVDKGILTGNYEFLDHWDNDLHTYMQQNYFYFYGTTVDGIHFNLIATEEGFKEQRIKGKLVFLEDNFKMKISFEEIPGTGSSFDITQITDKNIFPLKEYFGIIQIACIKDKKASLYNYDGKVFSKRKGYLVRGNIVNIFERKGSYLRVSYKSSETGKVLPYWIDNTTIQNANPNLWVW